MRKSAIIITLIVLFHNVIAQTCRIEGHILSRIDSLGVVGANVLMFEIDKGTAADYNGYFELKGLDPGVYSIGITLIGYKDTTLAGLSCETGKPEQLTIYLSECEFHIFGHSNICPNCGKNDMAVPILYGVASKKMIRKARKGLAYLGGPRTGCDPIYYCNRDSTKY